MIKRHAANTQFFRMLGHFGFDWVGARVAEIGFMHGADLEEAYVRRANIFGADINQAFVDHANNELYGTFIQMDAAKDVYPFGHLDLIYALDVIYFWDDTGIDHFAKECYRCLGPGGLVCVSIIENDWRANEGIHFRTLTYKAVSGIFVENGFKTIGWKVASETFYTKVEHLREWCYLLYQKPGVLV